MELGRKKNVIKFLLRLITSPRPGHCLITRFNCQRRNRYSPCSTKANAGKRSQWTAGAVVPSLKKLQEIASREMQSPGEEEKLLVRLSTLGSSPSAM